MTPVEYRHLNYFKYAEKGPQAFQIATALDKAWTISLHNAGFGAQFPDVLSQLLADTIQTRSPHALEGNQQLARKFFTDYADLMLDYTDSLYPSIDILPRLHKDIEYFNEVGLAMFSQRLAHGLIAATGSRASETQLASVAHFSNVMRLLEERRHPLGERMSEKLRGAMAHTALYKILRNDGFMVFMPDPESPTQVALWDLIASADLIAIKYHEGKYRMLVLDAKSDTNPNISGIMLRHRPLDIFQDSPLHVQAAFDIASQVVEQTIQRKLRFDESKNLRFPRTYDDYYKTMQYGRIQAADVTIPTHPQQMSAKAEVKNDAIITRFHTRLEAFMLRSQEPSAQIFQWLSLQNYE